MMQKIRIVVDVGRVSLGQGCSAFLIVFIDKRQRPGRGCLNIFCWLRIIQMFFRDNEDRFCRIRMTGRLDRKPSHGSTAAAKLAAIDLGLQQSAAPRLFESKELKGESKILEPWVLEGALFRDNLSAKIPFRPRRSLNS